MKVTVETTEPTQTLHMPLVGEVYRDLNYYLILRDNQYLDLGASTPGYLSGPYKIQPNQFAKSERLPSGSKLTFEVV